MTMEESLRPDELEELIHQKVRLVLMSALAAQDEVSFGELQDLTGASDGNLSVHLRVLEDADYLKFRKRFVGRRPRTSYRLTALGRKAFARYVTALAKLVRDSDREGQ